jgi:hypothetical protein
MCGRLQLIAECRHQQRCFGAQNLYQTTKLPHKNKGGKASSWSYAFRNLLLPLHDGQGVQVQT